jgi:hypothetical protein
MQISVERDEMIYDAVFNCFSFYVKDEAWGGPGTFNQKICYYCPYCGAELPRNLYEGDEYCDALEEAVGKEYCDIKEEGIPEEFKSDEWWRKRGL